MYPDTTKATPEQIRTYDHFRNGGTSNFIRKEIYNAKLWGSQPESYSSDSPHYAARNWFLNKLPLVLIRHSYDDDDACNEYNLFAPKFNVALDAHVYNHAVVDTKKNKVQSWFDIWVTGVKPDIANLEKFLREEIPSGLRKFLSK